MELDSKNKTRRNFIAVVAGLAGLGASGVLNASSFNGSSEIKVTAGQKAILPKNPTIGQRLHVICSGDWESKKAILKAKNEKIEGKREDLVLDLNRSFSIVYQDKKLGWIVA